MAEVEISLPPVVIVSEDAWLKVVVVVGGVASVVDGTLNELRELLALNVVDGISARSAHEASDAMTLAGAVKAYGHASLTLRFSSPWSVHSPSARSDTV